MYATARTRNLLVWWLVMLVSVAAVGCNRKNWLAHENVEAGTADMLASLGKKPAVVLWFHNGDDQGNVRVRKLAKEIVKRMSGYMVDPSTDNPLALVLSSVMPRADWTAAGRQLPAYASLALGIYTITDSHVLTEAVASLKEATTVLPLCYRVLIPTRQPTQLTKQLQEAIHLGHRNLVKQGEVRITSPEVAAVPSQAAGTWLEILVTNKQTKDLSFIYIVPEPGRVRIELIPKVPVTDEQTIVPLRNRLQRKLATVEKADWPDGPATNTAAGKDIVASAYIRLDEIRPMVVNGLWSQCLRLLHILDPDDHQRAVATCLSPALDAQALLALPLSPYRALALAVSAGDRPLIRMATSPAVKDPKAAVFASEQAKNSTALAALLKELEQTSVLDLCQDVEDLAKLFHCLGNPDAVLEALQDPEAVAKDSMTETIVRTIDTVLAQSGWQGWNLATAEQDGVRLGLLGTGAFLDSGLPHGAFAPAHRSNDTARLDNSSCLLLLERRMAAAVGALKFAGFSGRQKLLPRANEDILPLFECARQQGARKPADSLEAAWLALAATLQDTYSFGLHSATAGWLERSCKLGMKSSCPPAQAIAQRLPVKLPRVADVESVGRYKPASAVLVVDDQGNSRWQRVGPDKKGYNGYLAAAAKADFAAVSKELSRLRPALKESARDAGGASAQPTTGAQQQLERVGLLFKVDSQYHESYFPFFVELTTSAEISEQPIVIRVDGQELWFGDQQSRLVNDLPTAQQLARQFIAKINELGITRDQDLPPLFLTATAQTRWQEVVQALALVKRFWRSRIKLAYL